MARSSEPLPSDLTDIRPFVIKGIIVLTILLVTFIITVALIFNSEGYNQCPEPDIEQSVPDDMNRYVYISLPPPVFKNRNRRLSRALFLNLLGAGARKRRAEEEERRHLLGGEQSLSPSPSPDYGARKTGAESECHLRQEQEQEERGRKKCRGKRGGKKHKRRKSGFEERTTTVSSASSASGYGNKGCGTRVEQLIHEADLERDDVERRV